MAAAAEIGGFTAARVAAAAALRPAAHPAPAAAAPPQPRRAVAAQSLRTTTAEVLTADLAGTTNGAVHAQVSGILYHFSAFGTRPYPCTLGCLAVLVYRHFLFLSAWCLIWFA